MEYGLRIRVIGNMGYLPEDIVKIVAEAECMTKENNKTLLNVAFSYTGISFNESKREFTISLRSS